MNAGTVRGLALPAFAAVLWLFATLGLGGALGRSSDDYHVNIREPVTAAAPTPFNPFVHYAYVWRPAHIVLICTVRTYFDDHDRLIHIGTAAAHGLACLLLFGLLRKVTGSVPAAAAAALLFGVFPVNHEVALWFCTASTAIGSALFLWLGIAWVRFARASEGRRAWRDLGPMAVIAAAIPFFYEQPGAAVGALPLLYLAVCPRDQPVRKRLARALGATFVLGLTQVAFAAALIATAPRGQRGGVGSLTPLPELPARALEVLGDGVRLVAGEPFRQVVEGSWGEGLHALAGTVSWVWLVPLALTGAAWVLAAGVPRATRPPGSGVPGSGAAPPAPPGSSSHAPRSFRPLWLFAFGLGVAVLAFIPVASVRHHNVAPRALYVPLLGLAISLGSLMAAAHHAAPRLWSPRPVRVLLAALLVAVTTAGGVSMLGIQRFYARRSVNDERSVAALARLVPDPPRHAVFVPLRLDDAPTRTGLVCFDRLRPGVFETGWSGTAALRRAARRGDIYAAPLSPWAGPNLGSITADTARLGHRFVEWTPYTDGAGGGTVLPWASMVPFTVEADGRVRLVRRVVVERDDGLDLAVRPPIVRSMLARGLPAASTATLRLVHAGPIPGVRPLEGWRWSATGEPAAPGHVWAWGLPGRRAIWLHPTAEAGRRAGLNLPVPPSALPRRIVLRAAVTEADLDRAAAPGDFDLVVAWASGQELAAVPMDRRAVRARRGWAPVLIDVPPAAPSDPPRTLVVTVRPRPGVAPHAVTVPCHLSVGTIVEAPPSEPMTDTP